MPKHAVQITKKFPTEFRHGAPTPMTRKKPENGMKSLTPMQGNDLKDSTGGSQNIGVESYQFDAMK